MQGALLLISVCVTRAFSPSEWTGSCQRHSDHLSAERVTDKNTLPPPGCLQCSHGAVCVREVMESQVWLMRRRSCTVTAH